MQATTIEHPIIAAMQKRHFIALDVAPFVGSIAAAFALHRAGLTRGDWIAFAVMWLLGVIGIELGFHRYFSHAAFATSQFGRGLLAILGSMGGQGPVVTWASTHRHHHNYSDTPSDSHTPFHYRGAAHASLGGFIHAQLTWKWSYPYPNPSLYTPQLARDPLITKISRYYYLWIALGLLFPGLISAALSWNLNGLWTGLLFGGVIRLFLGQQVTFLINSLCHLAGSRPFETKDRSRNIGWLVPLTLGGSLHNSHHAFPSTSNNALLRGQVDPGYWVLLIAQRLGLVWNLRKINPDAVAKRTLANARRTVETESAALGEG